MAGGARIGWIGVGNMGTPMARNLLAAGHEVIACDRDAARLAAITAAGASALPDPAAVARAADVVFSTMPSEAALTAIVGGEQGVAAGLGPGKVFIDMSTVSPQLSAAVADTVAPSGAAYLRAPVSGSTALAAAAKLTIFCSGPEAALARCRPLLERLGSRITYAGPAEEARVLKLLVNILVCVTPALVGEALAFGARSGLDRTLMVDAIAASAAASPVVLYKADALKAEDWTPAASVDLAAKDLDLALESARAAGVPLPFSALAQQFNRALQATGDGGLDFFALSTWPERLIGRGR